MAVGICELLWIKIVLLDLKINVKSLMKLYCDNKATLSTAHNLVQHDHTKHFFFFLIENDKGIY